MLQPVAPSCDPSAASRRRGSSREPDLDELMRDPITQALMAADRVNRCELHALLTQVRESLR